MRPRGPLSGIDPGAVGTLGADAGFAPGAAVARPGSEVWIIYGDGAIGYGLVEFDAFVRHRIPVIAPVGNDAAWTQIAREQVKMLKDDVRTVLVRTDSDKVAEGFDAAVILVTKTAQVPAALGRRGSGVELGGLVFTCSFREGEVRAIV